ncbi:hypothetical protein NMT80_26095, partial [Escherichia coli]|nr:hypothetical protein [Escherichia coli]
MERAAILRAGVWLLVSWLVVRGFVIFELVGAPLFRSLPGPKGGWTAKSQKKTQKQKGRPKPTPQN